MIPRALLRRSLATGCAVGLASRSRVYAQEQQARLPLRESQPRGLATTAPSTKTTSAAGAAPGIRSLVLYQYDSCPFCNKVRAHLDFRKVPYIVVEVDPLFNSALSWSSYKKVPLAIINGEAVPDSTAIIDRVDALLGASSSSSAALSPGAAPPEEQQRWRAWVDERLVRLLTVCIYRTWPEAAQASAYLTQRNFSPWVRLPAQYGGTVLMYAIARRMRAKYGFPEDARAALCADLDSWVAAVGPDRPFLGGAEPCAADVAVFGALRAVRGLDTQAHALRHSSVEPWFRRMEAAVGGSALEHRIGEACIPRPAAPSLAT